MKRPPQDPEVAQSDSPPFSQLTRATCASADTARPRVTVIVPAYNAAATLDASIASVREQTFGDWELLISDDGSTDATRRIARRWAASDPRIFVLSHPNGGVSAARNRAAAAARGDFLAFLDSDDLWAPSKLAIQLAAFDAQPDLDICFTRARFVDAVGHPTGVLSGAWQGPVPTSTLLYGNPATTCSTLMVKRSLFKQSGGFATDLRFAEDLEWMLRASLISGHDLHALPQVLTDYRCNESGLSSQLEPMQQGWEAVVERLRRLDPPLVARHESLARAAHLAYLARRAVRLRLPSRLARHYLARSLASDLRITVREPRRLLFTLLASCLPPILLPRRY